MAVQGAALVSVKFYNNIFSNNDSAFYNWDAANPSKQDVSYDRNLYYYNRRHAIFEINRDPTVSFATWQSVYHLDQNAAQGNPLYIDAINGMFRVKPASPAMTLGVDPLDLNRNGNTTDIIPVGAYITGNEVIGRVPAPAILEASVGPEDQQVRIGISGTIGATYRLESATELVPSNGTYLPTCC